MALSRSSIAIVPKLYDEAVFIADITDKTFAELEELIAGARACCNSSDAAHLDEIKEKALRLRGACRAINERGSPRERWKAVAWFLHQKLRLDAYPITGLI